MKPGSARLRAGRARAGDRARAGAAAAAVMALLCGACARATPVAQRGGNATDGPGASAPAPVLPEGPRADARPSEEPPATRPAAPAPPPAPVPPAEIRDTDLAGLRAELASLRRGGRAVLVNYWATWCGACVTELPELGEMARLYGTDGPAILGVSLDLLTAADEPPVRDKVRRMLERARVSYPNRIVRGDQATVLEALAIGDGIPVSILYDAGGREAARWAGGVNREAVGEALGRIGG